MNGEHRCFMKRLLLASTLLERELMKFSCERKFIREFRLNWSFAEFGSTVQIKASASRGIDEQREVLFRCGQRPAGKGSRCERTNKCVHYGEIIFPRPKRSFAPIDSTVSASCIVTTWVI
ncbi:hypothetical protein CEXT_162761 [Caerostris extrusa]|uniref:Uncharacterized protein n=1 Tax=Caerostris extrusa TaxID=172846 RepID=A0AAV4QSQ6_CAEEX|nr:hypothetical protein CEXT_162761 [Caerostris extrusa]